MLTRADNLEINPLSRGFNGHLPGYKNYIGRMTALRIFSLEFRRMVGIAVLAKSGASGNRV